jgi:hypothetical protein
MGILITLLVYLVIIAIIWWVIGQLSLPPPIRLVAIIVIAIVAIFMLLSLVGGGFGCLDCGTGNGFHLLR